MSVSVRGSGTNEAGEQAPPETSKPSERYDGFKLEK